MLIMMIKKVFIEHTTWYLKNITYFSSSKPFEVNPLFWGVEDTAAHRGEGLAWSHAAGKGHCGVLGSRDCCTGVIVEKVGSGFFTASH